MFQNVAEESAKAKPSTPQSVRRMPNRQSIQTDQPKASMTGVVRVAVPVPVSLKWGHIEDNIEFKGQHSEYLCSKIHRTSMVYEFSKHDRLNRIIILLFDRN